MVGVTAADKQDMVAPASAGLTGGSVSFTVTLKVQDAVFPPVSVAVQTTVESPLLILIPFRVEAPLPVVWPVSEYAEVAEQLSDTAGLNSPFVLLW
jgi:hypothetical protein